MQSASERSWLEKVDAELPLVRTALSTLDDREDVARGTMLACAVAPFWVHQGPMFEGRRWLTALLEADRTRRQLVPHEHPVAAAWAARMSLDEGDLRLVDDIGRARAVIAANPHAVTDWLQVTEHLAYGLTLRGELARADELTAEAIERARHGGRSIGWRCSCNAGPCLPSATPSPILRSGMPKTVAVAGAIGYQRVATHPMYLTSPLAASR